MISWSQASRPKWPDHVTNEASATTHEGSPGDRAAAFLVGASGRLGQPTLPMVSKSPKTFRVWHRFVSLKPSAPPVLPGCLIHHSAFIIPHFSLRPPAASFFIHHFAFNTSPSPPRSPCLRESPGKQQESGVTLRAGELKAWRGQNFHISTAGRRRGQHVGEIRQGGASRRRAQAGRVRAHIEADHGAGEARGEGMPVRVCFQRGSIRLPPPQAGLSRGAVHRTPHQDRLGHIGGPANNRSRPSGQCRGRPCAARQPVGRGVVRHRGDLRHYRRPRRPPRRSHRSGMEIIRRNFVRPDGPAAAFGCDQSGALCRTQHAGGADRGYRGGGMR